MRTRSVITVLKILVIEGGAPGSNAHVGKMPCWAAANVVSGDCGLSDSTLLPANVLPKGILFEPQTFDPSSHVAAVSVRIRGSQPSVVHLMYHFDQMSTFAWPILLSVSQPLIFADLKAVEILATCCRLLC
jgi:hypothetical protein